MYVFDKSKGDLILFDSVDFVLGKVKYVDWNKLGGLFVWEIDVDNGDLFNVINV